MFPALPCAGKPAAEQGREVGELLLRRAMLRRCDHFHKKPPPGKKLAKYPRKLLFFYGAEAMVGGPRVGRAAQVARCGVAVGGTVTSN